MPTLILTPRYTEDAQALWRTASQLGWDVHRLRTWHISADVRQSPDPVLYVEALFGPTLAEQFGLRLLEPPDDWLPNLPEEFRLRWVQLTTLGAARTLTELAFVKPPNSKSFPARVYAPTELPTDYDDATPVLRAEVVVWEQEFRCFVLDRQVRTVSVYLRAGQLQREQDFAQTPADVAAVHAFVGRLLVDPRVELPRATVLDVGTIAGRGWAVVEQNAAWGSGIYGCDPEQVLAVLRHAAVPA